VEAQNTLYGMSDLTGINNRSFRYGDGLFESIKVSNGAPLFLEEHYERLVNGMNVLQFQPGPFEQYSGFSNIVQAYLKKGTIENARLRIHLYRNDGGHYTPVSDSCHIVITHEHLNEANYSFAKGLNVGIYDGQQKVSGELSSIKSASALLYVMAAMDARNRKLDDCLLLNTAGNVIESSRCNLFMLKGETFFTPPLTEGCINGVLRNQVMQLLLSEGMHVVEEPITVAGLKNANEVFMTNVIQGVLGVSNLDEVKYPISRSEMLSNSLNRVLEAL